MRSTLALIAAMTIIAVPAAAETANQRTAAHVFVVKMGKGDFSRLERVYAPNFKGHVGSRTFTLDEDNESGKALRAAAPDGRVTVERMAGEGDLVAVHWRAVGHNTVASAGLPGNGKFFDLERMTFLRFENGLIAEEWSITDMMSLTKQLGGE